VRGSDKVIERLTSYTVGFLVQTWDEKNKCSALSPCGSGVLIQIGELKGILTAGHVLEKIQKESSFHLFTISGHNDKSKPIICLVNECKIVIENDSEYPSDPPDMGFIQVSKNVEDTLLSRNTYYNFQKRLELVKEQSPDLTLELIVGIVAEQSQLKSITNLARVDTHSMVHAYGESQTVDAMENIHGDFVFSIFHNDEVPKPSSYGGLSGSPIWACAEEDGPENRILQGIAFYESPKDDSGNRIVLCNGPDRIYSLLPNLLRNKWPSMGI